jgi:saxitoxin biosynthesis operon SxtJ-like protein
LEAGIPARLSAREGRKFAFTVGAAFLVFAALAWWRDRALPLRVFAALGGLLVVAGVLIPTRLGSVQRAWMGLAHAISKVTTPIFMGVVYYAVMMPIGLLMRLIGRRSLVHPPVRDSLWLAPPSGGRSDLERQF